jgi:multidrug efflux pump subunit AcrB
MLPHRCITRALQAFALLFAAAATIGCSTQGPYITHATIQWPGATPRQMDQVIARPVGQRLFGATNGVVRVTSISTAGKVDFFATSDGLTKEQTFVEAMGASLADSVDALPRNAAAGPIEVLPKGQAIPPLPPGSVEDLSIEPDRARLIDAGITEDDVARAVAKAREDEAFGPAANAPATAPSAEREIQVLKAATLPSRDKPITLGDVARIQVVAVPDAIERRWP